MANISIWRKGGIVGDIVLFLIVGTYLIVEDFMTDHPTDQFAMIVWLVAECSLGVALCRHQVDIKNWPHIVAISASVKFCMFAVLLATQPLAPGRDLWVAASMYMCISQLLLFSAATNIIELVEVHMNPIVPEQPSGGEIQLTMDHLGNRNEDENENENENDSEYEMIQVDQARMRRDIGLSEIDLVGDEFVCIHMYQNMVVTSEIENGQFTQTEIVI